MVALENKGVLKNNFRSDYGFKKTMSFWKIIQI